ncbi:hypothetical protein D3C85_1659510 [compost metagenome]
MVVLREEIATVVAIDGQIIGLMITMLKWINIEKKVMKFPYMIIIKIQKKNGCENMENIKWLNLQPRKQNILSLNMLV